MHNINNTHLYKCFATVAYSVVFALIITLISSQAYAYKETMSAKIQFLTPVALSQSQALIMGPIAIGNAGKTLTIKANGKQKISGQSAIYKVMGNGRNNISYSCDVRKVDHGIELVALQLSTHGQANITCKNEVIRSIDAPDYDGETISLGMVAHVDGQKIAKTADQLTIAGADVILYTHYD